jgi:hypothetical protein
MRTAGVVQPIAGLSRRSDPTMISTTIDLPFPPSVNRILRSA